ncbi:MAG: class II aldolase/adducin family protein [Candidatus Tantalella remota]|nr:class II aldolase/adducin family protein [Candidatus Tantalella remota]
MNDTDMSYELARHGVLIHREKLAIGAGGNTSIRDGDFIIIKKKGTDMSSGNPDDYMRVSFMTAKRGLSSEMSSETPLHLACYAANADIMAVVHVHSPYSIAAATRTDLLKSPSYEFDCVIGENVPVVEYISPGSQDLGSAVSDKITGGANTVLLKRHGAVATGENIQEAYLRALALERGCKTFLHSDQT